MPRMGNFFKDDSGASAVEYVLLAALMAAVNVIAVSLLGTNVSSKFKRIVTSVGT